MPPLFRKKPLSEVNLNPSKKIGTAKKHISVFKTPLHSKFRLENFVKSHLTESDSSNEKSPTEVSCESHASDISDKEKAFQDPGIYSGYNNNQNTPRAINAEENEINVLNALSPDLFEFESQISYNSPVVKGAYIHFLEQEKVDTEAQELSACSQILSDYCMNDPIIKETYFEFLEKNKTKKPNKRSKKAKQNTKKKISNPNKKNNNDDDEQTSVNDLVINNNKRKRNKKMKKANGNNKRMETGNDSPDIEESDTSKKGAENQVVPIFRTHKEKMEWILETRNIGLYVLCDRCNKTRYLKDVSDPLELPEKWYCENHPDGVQNSCHFPQLKIPDFIEEQLIENLYNSGSIVWAHLEGFPWWPAMVDDCPETEEYFWLDDLNDTKPTWYHVTYFDTAEVTRNWLKVKDILPFKQYINPNKNHGIAIPRNLSRRMDRSVKMASEALKMPLIDRLRKYSFICRFKKPIVYPEQAAPAKPKPKRNLGKKKFNISAWNL